MLTESQIERLRTEFAYSLGPFPAPVSFTEINRVKANRLKLFDEETLLQIEAAEIPWLSRQVKRELRRRDVEKKLVVLDLGIKGNAEKRRSKNLLRAMKRKLSPLEFYRWRQRWATRLGKRQPTAPDNIGCNSR